MRVLRRSNIEEFMLSIPLMSRVQLIKNVKMNEFQFGIKLPKSNYRRLVELFRRFPIFNILMAWIKNLSRFFLNSFLIINGVVWPSQKKKWRLLSSS